MHETNPAGFKKLAHTLDLCLYIMYVVLCKSKDACSGPWVTVAGSPDA